MENLQEEPYIWSFIILRACIFPSTTFFELVSIVAGVLYPLILSMILYSTIYIFVV